MVKTTLGCFGRQAYKNTETEPTQLPRGFHLPHLQKWYYSIDRPLSLPLGYPSLSSPFQNQLRTSCGILLGTKQLYSGTITQDQRTVVGQEQLPALI